VREIPLRADVVARLREHRAEQNRRRLASGGAWVGHDLVVDGGLGEPVNPHSLTQAFKRFAERAGVPGARLHDLRHACASRLARSGLHPTETSALLGHASPSFTMSVYQHTDERSVERVRAALEALDE
jgi:integrase